jgi:hypothetical protein
MHLQHAELPSRLFYSSNLEDGVTAEERSAWHHNWWLQMAPFAFFDTPGCESQERGSKRHVAEVLAKVAKVLQKVVTSLASCSDILGDNPVLVPVFVFLYSHK